MERREHESVEQFTFVREVKCVVTQQGVEVKVVSIVRVHETGFPDLG